MKLISWWHHLKEKQLSEKIAAFVCFIIYPIGYNSVVWALFLYTIGCNYDYSRQNMTRIDGIIASFGVELLGSTIFPVG